MKKRTTLLALAAVSAAMIILPASASALVPWHLSSSNATFGIDGVGGTALSTVGGETITCTASSGSGAFTSSTGGHVNLVFTGCKSGFFSCSNTGTSGKIESTTLPFHAVMVATGKPGVLITGNGTSLTEEKHYATFSCFGVSTTVYGNGIIGTITSPECNAAAVSSATLEFNATSHGEQKHRTVLGTETEYDLKSRIGSGGPHQTAAMEGHGTITFDSPQSINCTHS